MKYFIVSHVLDTYEDGINIDEIVFFRAFYEGDKDLWKVKLEIRGIGEREVVLTHKRYCEFVEALALSTPFYQTIELPDKKRESSS